MKLCDCCSHIWRDGKRDEQPPVARWVCSNGNVAHLCQGCLDCWFDNADDDDDLEPTAWQWLDTARLHQETPAGHLTRATACT